MRTWISEVPPQSRLHEHIQPNDFVDAFSTHADTRGHTMLDIAQIMFGTTPTLFRGLLALRNIIVKPFGLKTTPKLAKDETVPRVGFFRVYSETEDEIILGEDDTHLDFRISVNRFNNGLSISTWVHRHNWFGRVYLFFVTPFHHVFSRVFLRQTARALK